MYKNQSQTFSNFKMKTIFGSQLHLHQISLLKCRLIILISRNILLAKFKCIMEHLSGFHDK